MADIEAHRAQLDELRVTVLDRVESAVAALAELTHDRDEPADDEHDPEGVTLSAEWSRLAALVEAAQSELRQVEDALLRVDAGTYGVCESCARPIPAARLEARPMARMCVDCASRR